MDLPELAGNADTLITLLLPADPDPTAALGARETFLTRAYLMLSCALIEEFLEQAFADHVTRMTTSQGPRAMACFSHLAMTFAEEFHGQLKTVRTDDAVVKLLAGLYISKVVKANNGMKRRDILALAAAPGLKSAVEDDCDDLLRVADTLGSRRGEIAHMATVDQELRPASARQMVADVLKSLPSLVKILTEPKAPPEALDGGAARPSDAQAGNAAKPAPAKAQAIETSNPD